MLKYNPKGEFLGFVPGVGYLSSPCLFRLDPEGYYNIGGHLSIFAEDGKKIKTINIPKDRYLLPEFKEKLEYGWGPMIELSGVDSNNNVYITLTKKPPIRIPDSSIAEYFVYDNITYKFNDKGELINFYRTPGSIGWGMEKEIQVTPDGSIYYWKYIKDRMELWRILPQ